MLHINPLPREKKYGTRPPTVEQNFTAKFSCRIIAGARVHYLPRNFEVVKLTQVNTLHGPARQGACELSNAILRRDRLLVNGAATAFCFQRNAVYVYATNKFVRMRETMFSVISLFHKPHYVACSGRAGDRGKK